MIELLIRIKRAWNCLKGEEPEPIKGLRKPLWALSSISRWFLFLTLFGISITAWHLFNDPGTSNAERLVFVLLAALFATERLQSYFAAGGEEIFLENIRSDVEGIRDDLKIRTTELTNTMSRTFQTKTIGSHTQAFHYVVDRLHAANRMKDTFFRVEEDQILFGHSLDTGRYMDACMDLLKRGGSIEFIFSMVNRNVALKVNEQIIDYIRQYNIFGRWQGFELDHHDTPVINLIILSYDDFREVLFGWNYSNTDDGLVFSSTNERVVQYFDALFDRMRNNAERLNLALLPASPKKTSGVTDTPSSAALPVSADGKDLSDATVAASASGSTHSASPSAQASA
jgi:hypothetical protein